MAAVERLTKRTARVSLNNGQDAQGNTKYVYDNISGLSGTAAAWDPDKYLAIIGALEPCLNKTLEAAETVATYSIAAS